MSPPESVTYMARRASPTARSTPDSAMPSAKGTLPGSAMRRKRSATSRVWPVAPNSPSSDPAPARAAAATTALRAAVTNRPEAAMRLARARWSAPSAFDTAAVTAMVRPMLIAAG